MSDVRAGGRGAWNATLFEDELLEEFRLRLRGVVCVEEAPRRDLDLLHLIYGLDVKLGSSY